MALTDTDVWVVGETSGFTQQPIAYNFDGSTWTTVPMQPVPYAKRHDGYLETMAAVSPTDIWAFGWRTAPSTHGPAGATVYPFSEHWNGSAWTFRALPTDPDWNDNNTLIDDAAVIDGVVEIAGMAQVTQKSGAGVPEPFVMSLHAGTWQLTMLPTSLGFSAQGSGGAIAGSSPSDLWLGGFFEKSAQGYTPAVIHWNGSSWSDVDLPLQGRQGIVAGITEVSPSDVWVVMGRYQGRTLVDHWDGASWSVVPSPQAVSGTLVGLYTSTSDPAGDILAVGEDLSSTSVEPFAMLHRASAG